MARRLNREQTERTRAGIKTSQLINRLHNHILGKIELSTTQIRAIEILLNKTLPNLQAVDMVVEERKPAREMTDAELESYLHTPGSGNGTAAPTNGKTPPDSVH